MTKGWENKRGQSPHAAILLFIVIMIISVLIAGTIIIINNYMRNQAVSTEQGTENQITTKFDIIRIDGYGINNSHQINDLWVYARLSGGSQPMQLNNLIIQFNSENFTGTLKYNNDSNYDDNFINSNHVKLDPKDTLSNNSFVFTRNDYTNTFMQANISILTNCSDYNWTTCYGFTPGVYNCPPWTYTFFPPPYPDTPPGYTTNYYNRTTTCSKIDTWTCEYWIFLQSRTCGHSNITFMKKTDNITCQTNTSYSNSFSSNTVKNYANNLIETANITEIWFHNTTGLNNTDISQSANQALNVFIAGQSTDLSPLPNWIPPAPTFPPNGIPDGIFTWRKTTTNITRYNITDYTNITIITIINVSNCTIFVINSTENDTICDTLQTTNITLNQIINTTMYVITNITTNDTINDTNCNYQNLTSIINGPIPQPPACGPFGIGCSFFNVVLSNGSKYLISTGTNLRDCSAQYNPLLSDSGPCNIDVDYFAGQPGYPLSVDIHAHGTTIVPNTFDSGVDFYTVYKGDPNKLWMGRYTAEPYELGANFKPNLVTYGDTYIFHIFTPQPLTEFEEATIKFIPVHGMQSEITFITPNTITSDRVKLFPKD